MSLTSSLKLKLKLARPENVWNHTEREIREEDCSVCAREQGSGDGGDSWDKPVQTVIDPFTPSV